MLLVRFAGEPPAVWPDELELGLRERNDHVLLFEHRADAPAPLLAWLANQNVEDIAIGTEDLRSLYDQFHGPNVKEVVEELR
jgi:ABC-2 type transport system ATP-binding protein